MFAPYCHQHGSRILLPTTAMRSLKTTDNGIVVEFECTCGQIGVWRSRDPESVR